MLAQALDLLVHLGVGRAFRRKLHLDGLVAGRLSLGLHGQREPEDIGLARLHQAAVLELGLGDGIQVAFVHDERIGFVHDFVGHGRTHRFGAERVVDDRARGLAATETGKAVLVSEILVGLLDASVDFLGIHRNGHLDAVVLKCLYFCLHVTILHQSIVARVVQRPAIVPVRPRGRDAALPASTPKRDYRTYGRDMPTGTLQVHEEPTWRRVTGKAGEDARPPSGGGGLAVA